MSYPKYNPLTNGYEDVQDIGVEPRKDSQGQDYSVYSLTNLTVSKVYITLVDEGGYSLEGAKRIAELYSEGETDEVIFVVVDRVTGIVHGLDIDKVPPPSLRHIPIIKQEENQFSLTFKEPDVTVTKGISLGHGINSKLELSIVD